MVWQVVIEFSSRSSAYTDMIIVWDIVPHDKVSAVVAYLNQRLRHSVGDRRRYKPVGSISVSSVYVLYFLRIVVY